MPGKRGGAAGTTPAPQDQPEEKAYPWLVLGEGEDARRFALKLPIPTYLLGKLFAAKTFGDILELQAKVLLAAVDDTDRDALDEYLETGQVEPDDAVNALLAGYNERPTKRSEHTSGGASDTTVSPTSSPSSDPGDAASEDGSSPEPS
jgi:hypothetical protein